MALYPEIVAGYEAAKEILADTSVLLHNSGVPVASAVSVSALLAGDPAYVVEARPLHDGISVWWNGRYGFDKGGTIVRYPAPVGDPAFEEKLAEVLLPVVVEYEAKAQAEKLADYAQDAPGSVYEARDAIREVTE